MKKKQLKGMTLVECIVAMAVLAISSAVLCTATLAVCKVKISTNSLNKKVNYESLIADNQIHTDLLDASGNVTKTVTDSNGTVTTVSLKIGDVLYTTTGKTYTVDESGVTDNIVRDADGNVVSGTSKYGTGLVDYSGNHNFKFFIPNQPTTSTTP
jgi:prepilin-type N-terminal cleavage/methylation domain-containing protein